MGMTEAPFSRDPISHLHGAPTHTVSKRTQPGNTHIHHAQPTVTRGEKEVEEGGGVRASGKSPAGGCPPKSSEVLSPPPGSGVHPRPRDADPRDGHAGGLRRAENRTMRTRRPAGSCCGGRWWWQQAPPVHPRPPVGTSTLLSRSPTYVPRVSLNSKIFLMSSACFFQEELLSPFSRAMADEGGVCRGRRGCAAGARGAGVGALRRGRPATGAQAAAAASLSGRAGAGARGCSAREPEETLCCGRASSSAVSSFTLAAAAVPPWLLFLLVSGTDFLPPPLAPLLCRRLPASLSATFLPPFSSLPAARLAPSPSSPSSSSRGLPALPARPGRLPPPASPPPARCRLRGCPAPRERRAPGVGHRRRLAAARALEPRRGQVRGTPAGARRRGARGRTPALEVL